MRLKNLKRAALMGRMGWDSVETQSGDLESILCSGHMWELGSETRREDHTCPSQTSPSFSASCMFDFFSHELMWKNTRKTIDRRLLDPLLRFPKESYLSDFL